MVPTGSVKDEMTTGRYLPAEVPAVPSLEFLVAAYHAWTEINAADDAADDNTDDTAYNAGRDPAFPGDVFFGVVHTKDSLYAREMLVGPKRRESEEYMRILKDGGVLASEMETSILFTLGQVYSQQFISEGAGPCSQAQSLPSSAIRSFADKATEAAAIEAAISFCLKTVEVLHRTRMQSCIQY